MNLTPMKMKWKFDGYDIYFVSTNESLSKDILSAAKHLKIDPTTTIIYDNTNDLKPTPGNTDGSHGSTSSDPEQTIHLVLEENSIGDQATELRYVYGDVDDATFATDSSEITGDPVDLSSPEFTGDGLAE
jgi:hypothetical protein